MWISPDHWQSMSMKAKLILTFNEIDEQEKYQNSLQLLLNVEKLCGQNNEIQNELKRVKNKLE